MTCHVWRTHGSSLGTDFILNEAGVCELLKHSSSFLPSPSLSPLSFFRSFIALRSFFSHTLLCSAVLPSFFSVPLFDSLLLNKQEGGSD